MAALLSPALRPHGPGAAEGARSTGGGSGMYRFAVDLLQPYPLLYLATGLAIANLWHRRRESRGRLAVVTLAFVALTLPSIPAVSHLALGSLEWQYPPAGGGPADGEAIVVLSAGVLPPDPTRGPAELDEDSIRRCLHAARLYHQGGPCPVLVSGGKVDPESPAPACAGLMRDLLLCLGVRASDVLVEDASRTTYENAVESAKLLRQHRLDRAVLITDAVDMFRAAGCFRKQGVEVAPAACHYRATRLEGSFVDFLPSPGAARGCARAWHEWLGAAWYRLWGRI
jgi:uncharacterized SAM-binding protein YcdF (DUF218 family)